MKVVVTMKDPDVMHDAVQDVVSGEVKKMGLPDDEEDAMIELRVEKECGKMAKWFKYGEYLKVEFDTEAMTATVLDAKREVSGQH